MSKLGMGDILKQAQKMQEKMQEVQNDLADLQVEGSAGGGMVTVVVNGKQEIVNVKIDKQVVDPDDIEMLQDLVVAAANEALRHAQQMVSEDMGKVTGGMNIPGMGNMFG